MTMQVGMVGKDGIVLVSDQLAWAKPNDSSFAHKHLGIGVTSYFGPSKLMLSSDGKIAVACAHDLRQATALVEAIFQRLTQEYWNSPKEKLKEITLDTLRSQKWRGASCLIVLSEPLSLYLLQCGQDEQCDVGMIGLYAFAGDSCNPATFWAHRYFLTMPPNDRTVRELLPLAAQVVVDAGRLNSGTVGGLEALYCDGSGMHVLTYEQNGELVEAAEKRGLQIREMILAPPAFLVSSELSVPQPTTDAPSSPPPSQE